MRTYLGMINFYHRFVQNLAFYLAPLNEYLKKEGNKNFREIAWTEEAKAAFQNSKDLSAESALLVYPRENCKLSIVADARHLQGDQNVVADALSRVEINNVKFFQEGLNHNELAKAQQDDAFIKSLIENLSKSSLKISEVKIENSDQVILCDVSTDKVRPIIPEQFQKVFDKIHNLAHSGIKATRNLLQRRFVWKNMKKNIRDWVKCCFSRQKGKIIRHNKSPLGQFNIPSGRFENLHVDLVGLLPSSNGCRYLLTVVDRFSCWFTATP